MDCYGLASKAGKIVAGADAVEEAIEKRKINLIIIAEDASEKTKSKFLKLAGKFTINAFVCGNIEQNSKSIGRKNKAIIAVNDKNFAIAICRIINGGDTIGQNQDT